MPIYDIQCLNKMCKGSETVESVMISFSELEELICVQCGHKVRQVIGVTNFKIGEGRMNKDET